MIGQELADIIIHDFLDACSKQESDMIEVVVWSPENDSFVIAVDDSVDLSRQTQIELTQALEFSCYLRNCQHGGVWFEILTDDGPKKGVVLKPSDARKAEFCARLGVGR